MSSRFKAAIAFVIAIGLLLACAVLVYGTLANFAESESSVFRTHQVQELLAETESAIASAARARLTYVFSGDEDALAQYQRFAARIPVVLKELREKTHDNPVQQGHCDELERLVNDRVQLWEKSVALKKSGLPVPAGQPEMTRQSVVFADEIVSVTRAMGAEESRLLQLSTASARVHFLLAIVLLVASFAAAVLLLIWHYRLLGDELRAREQAEAAASAAAQAAMDAEHKAHASEKAAHVSHEAARRLSTRLLQVQDDERRKFSRELHDSIGQYLAATKMVLASLAAGNEGDRRYTECLNLLDESLKEIRTISHLLHPPGLDEAGFTAAAKWYSEGFAKRSGVELKIDIAEPPNRLPRDVEIALFRVLQESLTNIHRHSKSRSAEVVFTAAPDHAALSIRDFGLGIPKEVLDRFRLSGTSGVGLAGMRERVRELGGTFEVESSNTGTCVQVTVPLAAGRAAVATADPQP